MPFFKSRTPVQRNQAPRPAPQPPEERDDQAEEQEEQPKAQARSQSDGSKQSDAQNDTKADAKSDAGTKDDGKDAAKGDAKGDAKSDAAAPAKKISLRQRLRKMSTGKKVGMAAVLLVLIGSGAYFGYLQYKFENTDDAYVQAYSTQIAPKVSGIVTHVLVTENQRVKAGQILMQIDRQDFTAAMRDAQASRNALDAQLADAKRDYERMTVLVRGRAVSRQAFDRAEATYRNLTDQVKAAAARTDEAKLNLDYTSVRAPSGGTIGRRSVDVGMYTAAGTAVLGFVPDDRRWVDANFKETQLSSIVPGRPARITVDSIPGRDFEAVVESVSPATGAVFTLLPPDNATGNFTKVVQRVPVRLLLKNLNADDIAALQAGLSAEVDIYKHRDAEQLPPAPAPIFAVEQLPAEHTQEAGMIPQTQTPEQEAGSQAGAQTGGQITDSHSESRSDDERSSEDEE